MWKEVITPIDGIWETADKHKYCVLVLPKDELKDVPKALPKDEKKDS